MSQKSDQKKAVVKALLSDRPQPSPSEMAAETIVANTTALLRAFGPDGKCTYVNKAWADFTGCDINGEHTLTDNIHPDSAGDYLAARQKVIPFKKDLSTSYLLLHRSGQYRWICEYSRPVFSTDGTFTGYLSTGVDMHDQKSQANYFTNKWSLILQTYFHNLRGTVSIVCGASELLQVLDQEQDRDSTVEMIRRNSRQMQDLMDQFLHQLSQEENGL